MRHFARRADIDTAVDRIAYDHRRGASALADAALAVLLKTSPTKRTSPSGPWIREVLRLGDRMAALRPSMPAIENALRGALAGFVADARPARAAQDAYRALRSRARAQRADLRMARERSAERFAQTFAHVSAPLLYSASSNVAAALCALERPPQFVTVCESRPLLEGRRMARALAEQLGPKTSVELITEAQAELALNACDAFIVGCDALFSDGSVANKVGTALIAGAAKRQRAPVVVVADAYRYAVRSRFRSESHPPGEVWRDPPPTLRVHNVAFEVVAPSLIHRIVVGEHVLSTGEVRRHWKRRHTRIAGAGEV
jgi:ribose 1,5-bisphosphate isomerase